MKKLKNILILFMIICLFCGLIIVGNNRSKEYKKTEFLMDTGCSVTFYGNESETAAEAVFDEIRRIDRLMDMYDDESDIGRINNAESFEKIKVSEDTYYVLKTALEICSVSNGMFDITIAPLSKLWNFTAQNPQTPSQEQIGNALACVGYENIVLENGDTVYKLNSETKIDLGAAAKGYAGDVAVATAKKFDLTGGIIDLGGNILCFGENPNNKRIWSVGIQKPFEATGTYDRIVEITEEAVVTSGTYQRYFEKSGVMYHHILNPETGYPKMQDYNSVTVVAKSSLEADCLATAIFVGGKESLSLYSDYDCEVYFE